MAEVPSVLDTLLAGRDSLLREVERLNAAIGELDSVLGRIGGASDRLSADTVSTDTTSTTGGTIAGDAATGSAGGTAGLAPAVEPAAAPAPPAAATSTTPASTTPADASPASMTSAVATPPAPAAAAAELAEPAPAVHIEPAPARTRSRAAKKTRATAKKTSGRARRDGAEPPKSIRVHVLEMLQAENREFGLAEIIDRVHAAGIAAHDDAVRSITIKLMKDGRVERVGRGQYRLARRGPAARASAAVATAPRVTEVAPEPAPDPVPAATARHAVDGDAATIPEPSPAGEQTAGASNGQRAAADQPSGGSDGWSATTWRSAGIGPAPSNEPTADLDPASALDSASAALVEPAVDTVTTEADEAEAPDTAAAETAAANTEAPDTEALDTEALDTEAAPVDEPADVAPEAADETDTEPAPAEEPSSGGAAFDPPRPYTPPLNLGQPWNS